MRETPLCSDRVHPSPQPVYQVDFSDLDIKYPDNPGTNVEVDKLRRLRVTTPRWWPVWGSFGPPLFLYYKMICASGQVNVGRSLLGLFFKISNRLRSLINHGWDPNTCDDFFRSALKSVSSWAFKRVFSKGPAYMLLTHLHALGGPAPYTQEQIISDITNWVSSEGKGVDMPLFEKCLDKVIIDWYRGEPEGSLSFAEYCDDVMRWGTSGGAPKSTFLGSTYRTKWAWGLSRVMDDEGRYTGGGIYKQALAARRTAIVALKREPTKTREVIATGMASYLRQSYLLYRWGKPVVDSPISNSSWLPTFQQYSHAWYGCIDGERFDQSIPADVVYAIIDRLGRLDDECRMVAGAEMDDLNNLRVEYNGMSWPWRGGLLSGWRLTSLVGTLVSMAAAEYIIESTQMTGAIRYGMMGDDLVLFSDTKSLTPAQLAEGYAQFGLHVNIHKTTSGPVGEFLRKTVSQQGCIGYPALGLRSVVYASPWVSGYTFSEEVELSNSWLTFYSRMLPHTTNVVLFTSVTQAVMVKHLSNAFGRKDWTSWLATPISAGGGGPMEWSVPEKWCSLKKTLSASQVPENLSLAVILGVIKTKKILLRHPKMEPQNLRLIKDLTQQLKSVESSPVAPGFKKNVNITKLCCDYITRAITTKQLEQCLRFPLPRGMKDGKSRMRVVIVEYLTGLDSTQSGITTVCHTKEVSAQYVDLQNFITRGLTISKRFANLRYLAAATTMYSQMYYGNVKVASGTW